MAPGVNPLAASASDDARRPTTEDAGRRWAFAATEGDARPVGSCDAELEETVWPHQPQEAAPSSISDEQFGQRIKLEESYIVLRMRRTVAGTLSSLLAVSLLAAEGSAGGLRWSVPAHWSVAGARPMRMATYTIAPAAAGAEAGECGVFFFGKGQGGTVDENLTRWEKQFEAGTPAKRSEKSVQGFKAHLLEISGTYLAPGGPMMQSQGKKAGWRLIGAIIEAPDGLVFFKCVGPDATIQAARKDFDALLASLTKATAKA
jgi:hypothetical protein